MYIPDIFQNNLWEKIGGKQQEYRRFIGLWEKINIGNLQEFQIHTDEMLIEKQLFEDSHIIAETVFTCF